MKNKIKYLMFGIMIMFIAFMLFGCRDDGSISFTLQKCDSDEPKVFLDYVAERTGVFFQKGSVPDMGR